MKNTIRVALIALTLAGAVAGFAVNPKPTVEEAAMMDGSGPVPCYPTRPCAK